MSEDTKTPTRSEAREALQRLFDQAYGTAGDQSGRTRVWLDGETVRGALTALGRVEALAAEWVNVSESGYTSRETYHFMAWSLLRALNGDGPPFDLDLP